jgi:hypothetical protein
MTPSIFSGAEVRTRRPGALTGFRVRAVLSHANRDELPMVEGIALGLILSLILNF